MKRLWALPLAPLYAAGSALRWIGVKPQRLTWPVVSVGSLSAGGAGKTPFVIALARLMTERGWQVDVLSRGYGRAGRSVALVDVAGMAEEFGDEPLLIARETGVPVFVGVQRLEAGRLAEGSGQNTGPSTPQGALGAPRFAQDDKALKRVHLLDDGFQHRQLARDVDVVLVSSVDLDDWLLPAGNRREPLSALGRADVFAVAEDESEAIAVRLRRMGLVQPIWPYHRAMAVPKIVEPVLAFCGIARPGQFFGGLEQCGVSLVARKSFPDHHRFSDADLKGLWKLATETRAAVMVTTAKDAVRLGNRATDLRLPLAVANVHVSFVDEEKVFTWLRDFQP